MYEGDVTSVVLISRTGEIGVMPRHASEICALGQGVMRMKLPEEDGGGEKRIIISGGYAEIASDTVVVLADHARASDDIQPDIVRRVRENAENQLAVLPKDDHRRAYYTGKVEWCDLLLKNAEGQQ